MQYIITPELLLTDETERPDAPKGIFFISYGGRLYGPEDRLPGWNSKARRIVGCWALGACGPRTDAERIAAIRFLCRLPSKPLWRFQLHHQPPH